MWRRLFRSLAFPFPSTSNLHRSVWTDAKGYTHFDGRGPFWTNERRKSGMRASLALLLAGGLVWHSNRETVPFTNRKHLILVPIKLERMLGSVLVRQTLDEARSENKLLSPNHPYSVLVRRIGQRLAAVTARGYGGGSQSHLREIEWEYYVINEPTINAFVMPGGKVVVYRGLIDALKDTDALAGVIAHEFGHVVARHIAEKLTSAQIFMVVVFGLAAMFNVDVSPLVSLLLTLPNSRRAEHEADTIGLELMSRACFNPKSLPAVFDAFHRLEQNGSGSSPPPLLSTHPTHTERIVSIAAHVPAVIRHFERAECAEFRRALVRDHGLV